MAGSDATLPPVDGSDEMPVVEFLIADRDTRTASRRGRARRENLRTCREVLPREAWQAVNDLSMYVRGTRRRASTARADRSSTA